MVFTKKEVTPGRNCEVVSVLQKLAVVGFCEKFQDIALSGRDQLPDLSLVLISAGCTREVNGVVAPPHALAAREDGSSFGSTAFAQIVIGVINVFKVDPSHRQILADRDLGLGFRVVGGIALGNTGEGKSLQFAAGKKVTSLWGGSGKAGRRPHLRFGRQCRY